MKNITHWLGKSTEHLSTAKAVAAYLEPKRYNPMASSQTKESAIVDKSKLKPTQFNVGLGTIEVAQQRWEAYERAAKKAGAHSLSAWARELLDKEAEFKRAH